VQCCASDRAIALTHVDCPTIVGVRGVNRDRAEGLWIVIDIIGVRLQKHVHDLVDAVGDELSGHPGQGQIESEKPVDAMDQGLVGLTTNGETNRLLVSPTPCWFIGASIVECLC